MSIELIIFIHAVFGTLILLLAVGTHEIFTLNMQESMLSKIVYTVLLWSPIVAWLVCFYPSVIA